MSTAAEELARWRQQVLSELRGTVLDLGAGHGPAARHLRPDVRWLALEPFPSRRLARTVAARPGSQLLAASASQIPLPDASVDAVVCSMVLCSVPDLAETLAEVRRVVRPAGRVVFFEHVAAAPTSLAHRAQRLITPLTKVLWRGCDSCRDSEAAIRQAGFAQVRLRSLPPSRWIGWLVPLICGDAVR
ncbi:MAG: class I SAM-dependent methyltransferase [Actinomycetia bacterium]|nr:class I SAM-dependent methyltransferase [Actinomycetes bacterium]